MWKILNSRYQNILEKKDCHKKSKGESSNKVPHERKKKKKKREQPRGSRLEKEDSQERELCVEKKIKRREQSVAPLRKIISVCVCESKEKQESFFFSRETYIRIIVIDLIIVKLFRVCLVIFSLQRESVFHVNFVFLCVIVILNY